MSGGAFDYQQNVLPTIIDQIQREIVESSYSKETKIELQRCVCNLQEDLVRLNLIDWLLSGDDSEETFHERLKSGKLNTPSQ